MSDFSSSNSLHQIIYCSTFSAAFPTKLEQQDEEIANIVNVSILNNAKNGLTGLLIAHQNWFLQVLEGPAERVMTLYGVILSDTRHLDVTLVSAGPIPTRNFYNWKMCARRLSKVDDAILKTLQIKGTFSPKMLGIENALKLLMAVRTIHSRRALAPSETLILGLG